MTHKQQIKQLKPQNKQQFGQLLAGLIDADGHIDKQGYVNISFHQRDLSVARYVQAIIGGGSIMKIKHARAYGYRCNRLTHLIWLSALVGSKLKTATKIDQFNQRLASRKQLLCCNRQIVPGTLSVTLTDHWLVGFIMGDGSFQIQINDRSKFNFSTQVIVCVQISQKDCTVLKAIQKTCGGVLYYVKAKNYTIYNSGSLKNSAALSCYLDQFNAIGRTFKIYQVWRQALHLVLNKQHLTRDGLKQIENLKTALSNLKN